MFLLFHDQYFLSSIKYTLLQCLCSETKLLDRLGNQIFLTWLYAVEVLYYLFSLILISIEKLTREFVA